MPKGNKPATTTTRQEKSPWAPAIGNLQTVLDQSKALNADASNWTPTYSGSTMAGIQGLEDVAQNFAQNGSGAYGALSQIVPGSTAGFNTGLDQLTQTADGGNLNSNPHLEAALAAGREGISNGVNSSFAGAGRYGSAAHTGALTKGLGQLETQVRMGEYGNERAAQEAAAKTLYGGGFKGAGFGGQLDQSQLNPLQLLLQAGGLRDQQANAARMAPMQATDWLARITNPIAQQGGTSTTSATTTQPVNRTGQIMGGVQMGLGLLTGNPMVMAGGAGGLLGGGGTGSYGRPDTMGSQGAGWEGYTPAGWGT